MRKKKKIPPTHPGEIVKGLRSITVDTAIRLSRYFNTSREFWLGLQMQYDLDVAQDTNALIIEKEIIPLESFAA